MLKKVVSLALCLIMALSMCVAASATSAPYDTSIPMSGTIQAPTLSVIVQTSPTGGVYLNPYHLSVVVDPDEGNSGTNKVESTLGIAVAPIKILNTGDTNIIVKPSAEGVIPTGVKTTFATKSFTSTPVTTKSVFMYVKSALCPVTADATLGTAYATYNTVTPEYDSTKDILVKKGVTAVPTAGAVTLCPIKAQGTIESVIQGTCAFADFAAAIVKDDDYADNAGTPTRSPAMEILITGEVNGLSAEGWTSGDQVNVNITLSILPTVVSAS